MLLNLENELKNILDRSFSTLTLSASLALEESMVIDGSKRSVDTFSLSLSGALFKLKVKRVKVNKTFFKNEEEASNAFLNGMEGKEIKLSRILSLLKDAGYSVPLSLFEDEEYYEIKKTEIKRDEKGRTKFFNSLRSFDISKMVITLFYDDKDEGSFYVKTDLIAKDKIDIGSLSSFYLGILDYDKKVTDEKRLALIAYLKSLVNIALFSGLERPNIIDYMTLLEAMQDEPKNRPFKLSVEKERSEFSLVNPDFGGSSYADYGRSLSPLDFAYYIDGFSDSSDERRIFFSYFDELDNSNADDPIEDCLKFFGLDKTSCRKELDDAYKKKMMGLHPDKIASYNLDPAFLEFANAETAKAIDAYNKLKNILK